MGETVIIHGNPNHSGHATFCISAVDIWTWVIKQQI